MRCGRYTLSAMQDGCTRSLWTAGAIPNAYYTQRVLYHKGFTQQMLYIKQTPYTVGTTHNGRYTMKALHTFAFIQEATQKVNIIQRRPY